MPVPSQQLAVYLPSAYPATLSRFLMNVKLVNLLRALHFWNKYQNSAAPFWNSSSIIPYNQENRGIPYVSLIYLKYQNNFRLTLIP
jgi:hypothetical protein